MKKTNDYSYSAKGSKSLALPMVKEQIPLFFPKFSPSQSLKLSRQIPSNLSKRKKLFALLEGELNFHGENSSYASHDFHAFAAKFPPQLPREFIRFLTKPGDIVLDPMMGSGTTLVEASLAGRIGIGFDIDPLALRIGQAKTMALDVDSFRNAGHKVLAQANQILKDHKKIERFFSQCFDEQTKKFIDYWFLPDTQRELISLVLAIQEVPNEPCRRSLELIFSSIIITKSGGVSRARDLAHSRPHLDVTKSPKNALGQFATRFQKHFLRITQVKEKNILSFPMAADARRLPVADNVVDLIVTSPPYANAIDYMRAHKFSLVWFGESVSNLSKLRAAYIGSERIDQMDHNGLPPKPLAIIENLQDRDRRKSAILKKYFVEMKEVIFEMHRVLRKNSAAIVVVGTSVMRGLDIQTHSCLADIATEVNFEVVGIAQRALDRNKRMMPARFRKSAESQIEQRMHEEYVIGLLKR